MQVWSAIQSALKIPKDMRRQEARQEYITRATFMLTGMGLFASTFIIIFVDLSSKKPAIWPIYLMLGMDTFLAIGWYLIQTEHWKFTRYFFPLIFLLTGGILASQPDLLVVAVLQFVLCIILTALLFTTKAQWVAIALCAITYISVLSFSPERYSTIILGNKFVVVIILIAIGVIQQLSSNLLVLALEDLTKEMSIRNKTEESILKKEAILSAIAKSAQALLESSDWRSEINNILQLLGNASNASHAYLFENKFDENNRLVTSQTYEWAAPGEVAELENMDYQSVPVLEEAMKKWYETVSIGKPFYNSTKVFQSDWADTPSRQEIKTLLDVPVFVRGQWWGIIGFDDLVNELPWSQAEVDAMQIAAGLLGAAITRQLANEAVQASEFKFQTVFHETSIPMLISRISHRTILDVNESFCNFSGYRREEIIGRTGSDLKLWVNETEYLQHRDLVLKQGYLRDFKTKIRKKDGQISVSLISVTTIEINNEICLLYTTYDITKLEELLVELQDKNNELERFTYTVSHDLKAPLITIGGFVGFLEKDVIAGNQIQAKRDISRIMEAVQKMEQLLNELLELSRVGRMVNDPESVSFEEMVKDALRLVQGGLEANQIKVEIEAGLPAVKVDRSRIIEVLQNLLDNASKFMGQQTEPKITIGVRNTDEMKIFFVKDNGIGIDPEYHERVFGLFNKLDVSTEGTGVGLALVKRIIEFHNGKIWIESDGNGTGTTFCFTLP
ncbi:MAG: ATP-binding protein [Anaerolineales bacterium]